MNTFDSLQTLFRLDLQALHELQKRGWRVLPTTRVVKEEHLGRCCFLAEEFLNSEELCVLKHDLNLDEQQWRTYKEKLTRQ